MRFFAGMVAAIGAACLTAGARAQDTAPASQAAAKAYVVVFDFADGADGKLGPALSDSLRLKLRRNERYEVIDRLTTQEFARPLGADADRADALKLMAEKLGANLGLYGTVRKDGAKITADVVCLDLTGPQPAQWRKTFSDDTERARGVIATAIVEAVTGGPDWKPPEYGDETEPTAKELGKPLNANGGFDAGAAGWEAPDNVGTFLVPGPPGRGTILRVRTDLERDPWLEYRKALRMGKADLSRPPQVGRDTSYDSVAALEGVHFAGEWIRATPGRRYWLTADHNGQGGAKVFVKGFKRTEHAMDGLPESSLAAMGMTPEQFANLPPEKRKELVEADAKKNPMRYVRECYRWYLNCKDAKGEWKHLAAPFPPRGGLPADVEWLQIQIYSYWPPGEYLWDNVHLYADPRQKAPLAEEKARTPHFGKTSDVVERETAQPRTGPASNPAD